jgi:hypothetical protein
MVEWGFLLGLAMKDTSWLKFETSISRSFFICNYRYLGIFCKE